MTFLGIAVPALLVALALRRWYGPLPWRVVLLSLLLAVGFLSGTLFTTRLPVPVDEVMRGYPYRGVFGAVQARNPLTNDTVKQILPWMQIVRDELRHGRVPLWNRHQFSGYPLLANGQSAPFSPLFLATLFVPLPDQIVAMAGLKIFLALVFGWLFLRDEGVSSAGAFFGSALFAFSVFQTVYLYYPLTSVTSLLPAAAFATLACVRRGGRRHFVLLALVTAAVAAGGHPESAVQIGLASAVLLLLEWKRPHLAVAAALVGGALAAPAWLPVAEQALLSVRSAALAAAPHPPIDPLAAWLFLNPDGFGNPARGNWQWIYNYATVAPTYLGLVPLALAAGARRRREWLLLGCAAFLFLAAMQWTIAGRAFNEVPPMSLIAPDRLRFVVLFLLATVAARVVDRNRQATVIAAGLVLLAAAFWLLRAKWGVTLGWQSTGGLFALAVFLAAYATVPRVAPLVAAAAVVVELLAFNMPFNALTSRAYYVPRLPLLERLQELSRGEPARMVGHDWTFLPNAAAQYGLEDVRGSDPMALASYARYFAEAAADDPSSDVLRVQDTDHPALPFLGVRFLISDPSFVPSARWMLRYEGPDGKLFECRHSKRRFFSPDGRASIGTIVQQSPTRLSVEIDASSEAQVHSSQVAAPGWRVEGALRTFRIDGTFIGFSVPPGRTRVTLRYLPRSFQAGCVGSLAAVVLLLFPLRRLR